jgi:hypothetical protein
MRGALLTIGAVAALSGAAAAKAPASFPILSAPLERAQTAETYRRLPVREADNEIRIEVNADLLYSFEDGKIRASASDLFQQAANLIYGQAQVAGAHRMPLRPAAACDHPEGGASLRGGGGDVSRQ